MTIRVSVEPDALDVDVQGWFDVFMCLNAGLRIPRSEITDAWVATWDEVLRDLGWRVGGAYWPGRIATGWYTIPGRKGLRQFLAVYRDRAQLLVVETTRTRPARLVLAVPDPHRLVERLNDGPGPG